MPSTTSTTRPPRRRPTLRRPILDALESRLAPNNLSVFVALAAAQVAAAEPKKEARTSIRKTATNAATRRPAEEDTATPRAVHRVRKGNLADADAGSTANRAVKFRQPAPDRESGVTVGPRFATIPYRSFHAFGHPSSISYLRVVRPARHANPPNPSSGAEFGSGFIDASPRPSRGAAPAVRVAPPGVSIKAVADVQGFYGTDPAIANSAGGLNFKVSTKQISWVSDDTKLGAIDTGGLVATTTFNVTGANPAKLTFTATTGVGAGRVKYSGTLQVDPQVKGTVTVTKGVSTVRYIVTPAKAGLAIFKPKVIDVAEPMIPDGQKLTVGAQTWVNIDNDDKDGKFDLADDNVVGGDVDLVKVVLTVGPRGVLKGTGKLEATAGPGDIKVWDGPNKGTQIVLPKDFNLATDFAAAATGRTKTVYVEGISASAAQQGTKLKFTFVESAISQEAAVTVLGVDKLEWIGRQNGFTGASVDFNNNTLDADPNFPAAGAGIPGSNRVFADGRIGSLTTARDKVDLRVSLKVKPVEAVKLSLRSFDLDDPSTETTRIDPNDLGAAGTYMGSGGLTFTTDDDNRGAVAGLKAGKITGQNADAIATVTFSTADLMKTAEFQVSQFAGDSYRAVASGNPEFLKGLRNFDMDDGFRIVDSKVGTGAAGEILEPGMYASNALSVWRMLHVEQDAMEAPTLAQNSASGTIESLTGGGNTVTIVGGAAMVTLDGAAKAGLNDGSGGNGRFENGLLVSVAGTATAFAVASNTNLAFTTTDVVTIDYSIVDKDGKNPKMGTITNMTFAGVESTLTVTGLAGGDDYADGKITVGANMFDVKSINGAGDTLVTKQKVTAAFVAVDDDMNADGTPKIGAPRFADTSLMNMAYNPVYIQPVYDGGGDPANDTKDVAFLANIDSDGTDADANAKVFPVFQQGSTANEGDKFWVIYLLAAFQIEFNQDRDPDSEGATGGITAGMALPAVSATAVATGGDGAAIFLEAIRDRLATAFDFKGGTKAAVGLEARIVAHEVGHEFGLAHNTDIMMTTNQLGPLGAAFVFSSMDQNLLRDRVKSPGKA